MGTQVMLSVLELRRESHMRFGLALAITLFVSTASASTFYVDARKGLDKNDGSRDAPWRTIQKAADLLAPGDRVVVSAGNYPERIHLTQSGSSGHPITYQASGRAVTGGFTIVADYVRIAGFEITSHSRLFQDNYGVYLRGQHDEVLNNYIHDVDNAGITLAGKESPNSPPTAYNVVKGNRIYRASSCGIHVDGKGNLIEGNDITRIVQYPPGAPMFEGADADGLRPFGTGHIFRNNRVHDIRVGDLGNLDPHIDCIETWGPATNMLFENNVCDIGQSDYIPVQGAQIENGSGAVNHLTFRNNIFRRTRIGIHLERLGTSNITSIQVVNNRFCKITHQAILIQGPSSGRMQNNVFFDVGSRLDGHLTMSPDAKDAGAGFNK